MAKRYPDTDSDLSDDNSDNESYPRPDIYYYPQDPSSGRYSRYSRPLIDYVKNEWQTNAHNQSSSSLEDDLPQWARLILTMMAAPRFRRYLVINLLLLVSVFSLWKIFVTPQLKENATLVRSLDPQLKDEVGGWFGANSLPGFDDLVKIRTLSPSLLPADQAGEGTSRRRLIVVGDVHGCKLELDKLLEKVSFNPQTGDHLIFTGDMINKGPGSLDVVDLARKHSASCVRGNHEDRILLLRRAMYAANELDEEQEEEEEDHHDNGEGEDGFLAKKAIRERKLAKQLNNDQARWLEECPVILKVGQIRDMGQVVVVHGGLVPGVDIQRQDPSSVMNMRTIDLKTHVPNPSHDGVPWSKLFNKQQSLLHSTLKKQSAQDPKSMLTTVIYGHDSASSLQLKKYTKGLDTGCYRGGKLTALVIEDGGKQGIVQVNCRDYR